jgi:hypothetical protein
LLALLLDFGARQSMCGGERKHAMPTNLITTTSELSSGPQQLGAAARPDAQSSRSRAEPAMLRIEIAVAIEITGGDFNVNVVGSIGLRVSRA